MRDFKGKRVLITGGAKGIGLAIALEFARQGADLYLLDIDQVALADAVSQCKIGDNEVIGRSCDISQPSELSEAIAELLNRWGYLDILVNNAAVCFHGPTWQMSQDQWDRQLGVNLLAPIQLTRELLPHLLARPQAHILNVASIYGLMATNRCAIYHLTKFGLVGFSEALRAENGRRGLGVTALCPGFVHTDLFKSMPNQMRKRSRRQPPKWLCSTAEHVASAALRGIRRDRRLVLVSPLAHFLYHTRRIAPGLIDFLYRTLDRRNIPQWTGLSKRKPAVMTQSDRNHKDDRSERDSPTRRAA